MYGYVMCEYHQPNQGALIPVQLRVPLAVIIRVESKRLQKRNQTRNVPGCGKINQYPPEKLTYPTWGKGKSSSKSVFIGDMLVPRRVYPKDSRKFQKI